jgi:hypothetical protein
VVLIEGSAECFDGAAAQIRPVIPGRDQNDGSVVDVSESSGVTVNDRTPEGSLRLGDY